MEINKLTEQFKTSLAEASKMAEKMQKVQDEMKRFTTPIRDKTVTIDGISCVVQLYGDRVSIILPKESCEKYFNELGKKKSFFRKWYK